MIGVYWKLGSAAEVRAIIHGMIFWKSASGRQEGGHAVTTSRTQKKMFVAQRPMPYLALTRGSRYGALSLPTFSVCGCQRHPRCYILRPVILAVLLRLEKHTQYLISGPCGL